MKLTKPERDRRLGVCAVQFYLNERGREMFYKQKLEPDVRIRNVVRRRKTRQDPRENEGYWVTMDFYVPASWAARWFIDKEEKQSTNT